MTGARHVSRRARRRRRRLVGRLLGAGFVVLAGFTLMHLVGAASAAQRGKAYLSQAEADLSARDVDAARGDLRNATNAFTTTRAEVRALGPVAGVARVIPLLRNHVKAVDTFASAGLTLSTAAQPLVDAADTIVHPADDKIPVSAAMDALRDTQAKLGPAVSAITKASDQVSRLRGLFLVGPLARARDDLETELPQIRARARSAEDGLSSLLAFAGGSGPKRYLFLSQNPDEVRPTGGYIGTYGVLTADGGKLSLERYDGMDAWIASHPQSVVDPALAGSPFRLINNPPLRRTLANVNSGPDWPTAAQLAADLWKKGGEAPVDGVISFTPGFMGQVLAVVGPVSIPSYGETVTAQNIFERLDFQTHRAVAPTTGNRKDFVAVLAEAVMHKLLDAPASQWEPLGQAVARAFDAKQALAWSSDPQVARTLATRHWDGAFPSQAGDFAFNGEFENSAKNGRGIRRAYDHHVTLNPDGSAHVITTVTITNTQPDDILANFAGTLGYITAYGPVGAVWDAGSSDPLGSEEPAVAGHPGAGWFKAAPPTGKTTLTVAWNAPNIATRQKGGSWRYDLLWLHQPDHTGDTVQLTVDLPTGARWLSAPPPDQFLLDQDFRDSWIFSPR